MFATITFFHKKLFQLNLFSLKKISTTFFLPTNYFHQQYIFHQQNLNYDKIQFKLCQNLETQIVTIQKLKSLQKSKIQIVTKLINLNCDKT